ncbi:DUF6069 family protein [Actinophytocola oryzae]|uniref:Putative secreted protein with PEP-CTERM sorting signal n=1 Tax=Actinophytocola oryzae TaxID=502181 RepID=A0A4R7VH65_9PSEU|nr:DUF6069 family protein [Actinophytocola oryzae]TDV48662.1 putative secreted protein with PEP-CTERM sorting signal [Actinophytocola oryzae]
MEIVAAVGIAAVAAVVVNLGIGSLARQITSVGDFGPLNPAAFLPLTLLGVVAGAAGWAAVRRNAKRPASLLRRLVPSVVLASFVPDIALYFVASVGVTPILVLMVMHLAVAVISVPVFSLVLPVVDEAATVEPVALAGSR